MSAAPGLERLRLDRAIEAQRTFSPAGVSTLPAAARSPPCSDVTAGVRSERFSSSTSTHARRYDMPRLFAADVMEPCACTASSSAILPGPTAMVRRPA